MPSAGRRASEQGSEQAKRWPHKFESISADVCAFMAAVGAGAGARVRLIIKKAQSEKKWQKMVKRGL